jgi:guanylate kinase
LSLPAPRRDPHNTALSRFARAQVGEESGCAALLDVDVKGAQAVYSVPGLEPVCIFVSPPSLQALEARLKVRAGRTSSH